MAEEIVTPKNDKEEVNTWHSRVSKARERRDDYATKHYWSEIVSEYKLGFDLQNQLDIDVLPINYIFAYVKTELPSLYIRDPFIKVNPKNRTSINTAKVLEAVINYIWYNKKIKREIKKCIIDTLLIGHSWLKTGYTGSFGTVEDNYGNMVDTVENEDFFAYHVPYDCILFDPGAIDPPYDCEWIAHDVWVPLEEAKKNEKYSAEVRSKLTANYTGSDRTRTYNKEDKDKHAGKVCITEIWDYKTRTVFSITPGCDEYLEAPKPWPSVVRSSPFHLLKFNFSNDEAFGISDVGAFRPQLLEFIKLRSAEMDHLKRYNRMLQADSSVPDDEINKLTQGITGTVIRGDITKGDLVRPIAYPPLPQDAYALEERIKEDIINVSGQSAAERGATQKTSTRSYKELAYMQQGAQNRRSEKIDVVEDFVEEIAAHLIAMLKQFVQAPYYVRVLGKDSPELQQAIKERASAASEDAVTTETGFTFTADDIKGEYDVEVVAGSSTPMDNEELIKTLFQALEVLPKTGAIPGGPMYAAIGKLLVETMGVVELKKAFEEEAMAQQQAKQEQAKQAEFIQQMQTAQIATKVQIDASNAATKQSKVQAEFLKNTGDQQIELLKLQKETDSEVD